jgi:hypothetical protein
VRKPEGKRPLERSRGRWEDNIKMDLREMRWGGMDWLSIGPVESFCEHGNKPSASIKCWKILGWLSEWRLLKKSSAPWS